MEKFLLPRMVLNALGYGKHYEECRPPTMEPIPACRSTPCSCADKGVKSGKASGPVPLLRNGVKMESQVSGNPSSFSL